MERRAGSKVVEPMTALNDSRIYPEPNSGCWLWVGYVNDEGYGHCRCKRTKSKKGAHRVVWESHNGPVPDGLEIDHLCRTRCCVNPEHLEPISHADNIRRGRAPALTAERNKSITHCLHGHEYTPENTGLQRHWKKPGQMTRYCRTCLRDRNNRNRTKRQPVGECRIASKSEISE